jgi:hypothetical protein
LLSITAAVLWLERRARREEERRAKEFNIGIHTSLRIASKKVNYFHVA